MSDDLTIAYMLGVEDMRSRLHKQADEIERLKREAAIRIDQIEREQEAHLKTMADLNKQAEMNARLLTENASFRGEIEKLRRDVKTAVMGDSAELADVKRENEKLREALRPYADKYHWDMKHYDEVMPYGSLKARDFYAAAAALGESGDE